jgi:hypothetical protein
VRWIAGRQERSSPAGRDMPRSRADDHRADTAETGRWSLSFDAMRGCGSVGVIPGVFCICSGPVRCPMEDEREM